MDRKVLLSSDRQHTVLNADSMHTRLEKSLYGFANSLKLEEAPMLLAVPLWTYR